MQTKKYTVELTLLDAKNEDGLFTKKETCKALDIVAYDDVVISMSYLPNKRKPDYYIATYKGVSTKLKPAYFSVKEFMEEMEHSFGKGNGVEQAIIKRYNELKLV